MIIQPPHDIHSQTGVTNLWAVTHTWPPLLPTSTPPPTGKRWIPTSNVTPTPKQVWPIYGPSTIHGPLFFPHRPYAYREAVDSYLHGHPYALSYTATSTPRLTELGTILLRKTKKRTLAAHYDENNEGEIDRKCSTQRKMLYVKTFWSQYRNEGGYLGNMCAVSMIILK